MLNLSWVLYFVGIFDVARDALSLELEPMGSSSSPGLTRHLPPLGRPMRSEFSMETDFIQLNHGSYGTHPHDVKKVLREFQDRAESNVDRWMRLDLYNELANVRQHLATYLNVHDPDDLVVIPNTTGGMNAIFRSMKFEPGDKILHFSTVYEAMRSLVQFIVDTSAGNVTKVEFPVSYPMTNEAVVENFADFLNSHTGRPDSRIRIAIIDHISSIPTVRNPIEELIPLLKAKNILVIIDGAHAIGHVPVDLTSLNPDYYITNCHKWLYAARGTAVMYVKKELQGSIHPSQISSSYAQPSKFQLEFGWTGTMDFSPYMTVPAAIKFRETIGENTLRNYTHTLAWEGGAVVAQRLGTVVLQTENQVGNMIDVQLPIDDPADPRVTDPKFWEPTLLNRFNLFTATHKHNGKIWARFSAQIYNDLTDFEKGAEAFKIICDELNASKIGN